MTAKQFFDANYQFAINAGDKFNINPAVILAVASYETAYGSSYSARNDRNYFGLSASSYYNSNFWDGVSKRATSDSAGFYRVYTSVQNSFYDFGWLISTASRYQTAYKNSYNITEFANAFAVSGYFTGNQANYISALKTRSVMFQNYLKDVSATVTGTGGTQNAGLAGWLLGAIAIGAVLKNKSGS